ncbi:hypothetical protein ASF87_00205 [Microbacterium sp. Leaf161]|nr:hypothetical protein ASF87_00205 [Microbacterium sp. Leaf161]
MTLDSATKEDFADATMQDLAHRILEQLRDGPGVALVGTWPLQKWGIDDAGLLFWGLGALLGSPRAQSEDGARLYSVGEEVPRGADLEMAYHVDVGRPPSPPEVIGLLCCRAARTGGASSVVSGKHVYESLASSRADLAEKLLDPIPFLRPDVGGGWQDRKHIDLRPVVQTGDDFRINYSRYWMDQGELAHGEPHDEITAEALAAFEDLLNTPGIGASHRLETGEMIFINNRHVLHARQRYEDSALPDEKRMLWRVWVDLESSS